MTAPGWYQAHGDPANTARYWDGQAWQGDPQVVSGPSSAAPAAPVAPAAAAPPSSGGVMYYDAGSTQVDLGDVATQTSLAEQGAAEAAARAAIQDGDVASRVSNSYAVSPYSVTMAQGPKIKDRRRGGGLNFALLSLASIIVPVVLYLLGVRGPLLWGAIGILLFGVAVGRNKAVTSIWSGMRTTR